MKLKDLGELLEQLTDSDLEEEAQPAEPGPPGQALASALGLFAAGLAVGAGLGLLLAPSSGRELRAQLQARLKPPRPSPDDLSGRSPARA